MKDDECFDDFYDKVSSFVNSSFSLDEKIPKSKVVRKVLRSLLERFRPKVTVIKESKDLDSIKLDELVSSLQTYELTFPTSKKGKWSIALKVMDDNSGSEDDLFDEDMTLFVKKSRNNDYKVTGAKDIRILKLNVQYFWS